MEHGLPHDSFDLQLARTQSLNEEGECENVSGSGLVRRSNPSDSTQRESSLSLVSGPCHVSSPVPAFAEGGKRIHKPPKHL